MSQEASIQHEETTVVLRNAMSHTVHVDSLELPVQLLSYHHSSVMLLHFASLKVMLLLSLQEKTMLHY